MPNGNFNVDISSIHYVAAYINDFMKDGYNEIKFNTHVDINDTDDDSFTEIAYATDLETSKLSNQIKN